jgi:hypothetical protein
LQIINETGTCGNVRSGMVTPAHDERFNQIL